MSHYQAGKADGIAIARGLRDAGSPGAFTSHSYRNGVRDAENEVKEQHAQALAIGLISVVSKGTGAVHYAVNDPFDESPFCGLGNLPFGLDVDRAPGRVANCLLCIKTADVWVAQQ